MGEKRRTVTNSERRFRASAPSPAPQCRALTGKIISDVPRVMGSLRPLLSIALPSFRGNVRLNAQPHSFPATLNLSNLADAE